MVNHKIFFLFLLAFLLQRHIAFGQDCNRIENATKMWQMLRSPNFPSKFPPSSKCRWRIIAPSRFRVKFQFNQFSLIDPDSEGMCKLQWIKLIDGGKKDSRSHTRCGKRSPGSLVSSGRLLQLILFSDSAVTTQYYIGFEATFSMTVDAPIFPVDTNQPQQIHIHDKSDDDDADLPPTPSNTLGAALDRLVPKQNSRFSGMTQNQRIEALNQLRNLGHNVAHNPVFGDNEEVVSKNIKQKTTQISTTSSILQNVATKKRKAGLSYTVKTILIVVAVLIAFLIIILLLRKMETSAYCLKIRKQRKIKNASKSKIKTISEATTKRNISLSQSDEQPEVDNNVEQTKISHRPICKKHKSNLESAMQLAAIDASKPTFKTCQNKHNHIHKHKKHKPGCKHNISQQTTSKLRAEIKDQEDLPNDHMIRYSKNCVRVNNLKNKETKSTARKKHHRSYRQEEHAVKKSTIALPNRPERHKRERLHDKQKQRFLNSENSDSGNFSGHIGLPKNL